MSSFSFQFDVDVEPELLQQVTPLKHDSVKQDLCVTEPIKKECFLVPCPHYEEGDHRNFSTHNIGDFIFKEALVDRRIEQGASSSILLHDKEDHDLIPGHYEGGFKIWECSYDLAEILVKSTNLLSYKPKRILELGCGHGVPGIIASKVLDDISEIVFSDFNSEVLAMTTWPNILLNCTPETLQKVRCIAGDWNLLSAIIGKFDLILSAETLYSAGSCQQVFDIIDAHLGPNGVALIASKKYYFGVGGGTLELQNLAALPSSQLHYSLLDTYETGHSNIREVIRLVRKKSDR